MDLVYILPPVQPIITARQAPGPVHHLDSISLRYGFHWTEDAEVPLPALLEECHQRLLGSLLIRYVEISICRVLTVKRTSPFRRRYPLVFGTWKFVSNKENPFIPHLSGGPIAFRTRAASHQFDYECRFRYGKAVASLRLPEEIQRRYTGETNRSHLCRAEGEQKLQDSHTADGMDELTPIAPREAIQRSLELLFIDQIRPRVIKASHVVL